MALRDLFVKFSVDIDQQPLVDAQRNVNSLVIRFAQLQRIAGFAMAALGARTIIDSADAVINLENRLRSVTNSVQEFESAQRGVVDVARATFSPIEDVAALFQRYTQVTNKLGLAQAEVLTFTQNLTMATKLSGATASETRGALIQLAQGIGTNFKASGQEIRSIQEQAPELAKIIAKAAGGSTDDLMAMAKAGKITSRLVVDAVTNAGPELTRAWAKRTKSFEDISNRFTVEWQMLVKQLLPTIAKIIDKLGDLVQWTQEWVEKGEAMNTMIAAGIIVVGALSVAFSALALKILLVTAPFIALYYVVEDFVTFMRGGDSYTTDFFNKIFGEGGADKAREDIGKVWDVVKKFFAFISDPNSETWKAFHDGAIVWITKVGEFLKAALRAALIGLSEQISSDSTLGPLAWAIRKLAPKTKEETAAEQQEATLAQGKEEYENELKIRDAKEHYEKSNMRVAMRKAAGLPAREPSWWDKLTGSGDVAATEESAPGKGAQPLPSPALPAWDPMKGSLLPEPNVSATVTTAPWRPSGSRNEQHPEITNNITVQGNATPEVARMIARETGKATAVSMGRGMDAIGASVGVPQ